MQGMQNGYAGYHTPSFAAASALTEQEIGQLAKEAADKSNPNGAPVVEVSNIFRLIADRTDQDTVALRAMAFGAATPGKVVSIQASLSAARLATPIVTAVATAPAVFVTPKLSRKAKIGIGVGIGVALAIGAAVGVGVMHARSR